jgi:hypothetical protein
LSIGSFPLYPVLESEIPDFVSGSLGDVIVLEVVERIIEIEIRPLLSCPLSSLLLWFIIFF